MRRRDFIMFLGGGMTMWPLAGGAQQKAMPEIGYLTSGSPDPVFSDAFRQGLGASGYVEGQNLVIEYRYAEGRYDQLPTFAADLVGRKVDLIVTGGGVVPALVAKRTTATIPIVFMSGDDPVETGLVTSLARPGGNITGFSIITTELTAKRFELLSQLVPEARVVALLVNPNRVASERMIRGVQESVRPMGPRLHTLEAGTDGEIEAAFANLVELQAGALLVGSDQFFTGRRDQFVALAARYKVPAIYAWREFAAAGGLISYGTSRTSVYRQAGIYAARILKGEKPADLPVQQPTTFELVINLKTAKTLGLSVPPTLLARADEVIE